MHGRVDHSADSWIDQAQDQQTFGRFMFLWIAFNQLYNFHCYDLHTHCQLDERQRQLADDLTPRAVGSDPATGSLSCGYSEKKGNVTTSEWGRVTCVVRFMPEVAIEQILHRPEVDFFLNRKAYNPISNQRDVEAVGVLNIYKTKTDLSNTAQYTLGFVHAMNRYRDGKLELSKAIQHLAYLLYTVRCNLMHGGKHYTEDNAEVVRNATPLLCEIVTTLRDMKCREFKVASCRN